MGKEPHGGGAGTGQTPSQPQAIPNVRSARAAESVRPGHGADNASERGVGLYGQTSHLPAGETRGREAEKENGLIVGCRLSVVCGSLFSFVFTRAKLWPHVFSLASRNDVTSMIVCGVIILAAGASSRMGKPKLLLSWGKTSVLGHLVTRWQAAGARQIAVVHAVRDQTISGELDRLGVPAANRILNARPERGMFSAIQCAASWGEWN